MNKEIIFTPDNFVSESIKAFDRLSHTNSSFDLFKAFVECYTEECSSKLQGICNHQRMMNARRQMSDEAREFFEKYIVTLAKVMQEKPRDYLGEIFGRLNGGNSSLGQFFTPYHVSTAIARMTVNPDEIKNNTGGKPITIADPACGSGSLMIATAHYLFECGCNPLDFTIIGQDIDIFAASMFYLQLTAIGAAAIVNVGNSLLCEVQRKFYTPAATIQKVKLAEMNIKNGTADKDDIMICEVKEQLAVIDTIKSLMGLIKDVPKGDEKTNREA